MPRNDLEVHRLSAQGRALLAILTSHVQKPGVSTQRPESLISYGEALELLNLPENAQRGLTDGKTLQLNGLNDLAKWISRHPQMPRITGIIISRSERDGIDGTRRPKFVPSAGYFKEYKRNVDDWTWWIEQVNASVVYDWSLFLPETRKPASISSPLSAAVLGQPAAPETFTTKEIEVAGTFAEGAQSEVTAKTRERSARLRDLARAHFITHSADGRLHCAICTWAPPLSLALSGPIVEIHHGLGISAYPTGGRALTFEEAIQHLTPLCPNCHRITHAKPGGGTFTLAELQKARI